MRVCRCVVPLVLGDLTRYGMKCNLGRLMKCIVVVIITFLIINFAVFLKSAQAPGYSGVEDGFVPVLQGFGRHRTYELTPPGHRTYEATTTAPLRLNSTRACPGLQMLQPLRDGQFQEVVGNSLYVYSAFQDEGWVKMIGLLQENVAIKNLTCQLWFRIKGGDPLFLTSANLESLPEDHGRRYTAVMIVCPIPDQMVNDTVHAVSLVSGDRCSPASNLLLVPAPAKLTSQFTVCVTPLNYRYSRAFELVEMLEMNKLLGAQKLVFYNHTTGANVDKVLEMYSRAGEVEVHPWHLPMKTDTWPPTGDPEVHYFAQLAALNDCLYRHKTSSKYLVFQDLDEFIIPYNHDNWTELIADRQARSGDATIFYFKCIFFRKEWQKSSKQLEEAAEKYKSVILRHSMRETAYLRYGTRSKYILNPQFTSLVGVHNVWKTDGKADNVPENAASLHHYRTWERPNDPQPRVEDVRAISRFGSRLVDKLQKIWSRLEGVPMDINISSYGDHV